MGRKVSLCPLLKMKRDSGQRFMRLLHVQGLLLVLAALGLPQLSHAADCQCEPLRECYRYIRRRHTGRNRCGHECRHRSRNQNCD